MVANLPSDEQTEDLDPSSSTSAPIGGIPPEVVWLSGRLAPAAALNAGIRRASAPVVILLDARVEPVGDFVTPLVAALAEASVAIAGGWGLTTRDMRAFEDSPAGDVDAVRGLCLAFRRSDYVARGPLDERFRGDSHLDAWWSLTLREEDEAGPARRAVVIPDLALVLHPADGDGTGPEGGDERFDGGNDGSDAERARIARRDAYRLLDRFGGRLDLLAAWKQ